MFQVTEDLFRLSVEDFLRLTQIERDYFPSYYFFQTEEICKVVQDFLFQGRLVMPSNEFFGQGDEYDW